MKNQKIRKNFTFQKGSVSKALKGARAKACIRILLQKNIRSNTKNEFWREPQITEFRLSLPEPRGHSFNDDDIISDSRLRSMLKERQLDNDVPSDDECIANSIKFMQEHLRVSSRENILRKSC